MREPDAAQRRTLRRPAASAACSPEEA